jgi:hypothetical protein
MGFHAYINEIHGSRSKIPSKKISSGTVSRTNLIPALNGEVYTACVLSAARTVALYNVRWVSVLKELNWEYGKTNE